MSGAACDDAEINVKHGCLGSGHRANACIGRALKLVMQNVGGNKIGGKGSPHPHPPYHSEAIENVKLALPLFNIAKILVLILNLFFFLNLLLNLFLNVNI